MKKNIKIKVSYKTVRDIVSNTIGVATGVVSYNPVRESIDDLSYGLTLRKLRRRYSGDVPIDDITDEEVRSAI